MNPFLFNIYMAEEEIRNREVGGMEIGRLGVEILRTRMIL